MKQNKHSIRPLALLPTALSLLLVSSVTAQSVWTTAGDGNWGESVNWLGGVPTIANAVTVTNAPGKVITVTAATPLANLAARRIDLSAPAGSTNTLRFENLGSTPFGFANSLTLNAGSRIEVINSFLQLDGSEGGNINQFAGDILLVSGGIATTNIAVPATNGLPALRIARSGVGQAAVLGGTLRAFDQLVVADLAGSIGILTLSNGLVSVGGMLKVANNFGAVGRIDVHGGSVIATNDTARVGDDGNGTFSQYAGTVTLNSVSVGHGSNSVGRLNLRGGILSPGSTSLGRSATAQGTLEVSGGTLELATSTLYIGREGAGTAIFSNGVAHVATVIIAASNSASGTLQMRGGSLTAGQFIADKSAAQIQYSSGTLVVTQATTVANGAAFIVGNGTQPATLQLDGGAHTFANGLVVSANATLKGTGTVVGTITVLPGGSNQLGGVTPITLTPAFVNSQFRFSFPSTSGKLYDVLATTNLIAPAWQLQTTLTGNGTTLTYTNTPPSHPGFFRVSIH